MLTSPKDSRIVQELRRLHEAQLAARTPEDREHANHEFAHFMRMIALGRADEYFANREAPDA